MAKITIFGLAGVGTTTAGNLLAAKLGYEFHSSGKMFRKVAEDMKMSLGELEELSKTDDSFDRNLDSKVSEYGKSHDNFVFESRLAWHFIPDSFKVAIICDLEERIRRIAVREMKDFEVAKQETLARESAIFERYKKYYGIEDVAKQENFDLILDSTRTMPEELVRQIVEALQKRS